MDRKQCLGFAEPINRDILKSTLAEAHPTQVYVLERPRVPQEVRELLSELCDDFR